MNYWLVKSEPDVYSWEDLIKDKKTTWDGVRNFQARNNLKSMKKGDLALFYYSNEGKAIVGITEISKESFPDPTDSNWVAVELKPKTKLKNSVELATIKKDKRLERMVLVTNSRLSVQPVKPEEFDWILALSEK
ncbi:MAG: EVE domain-containing protein [Cytophagales bacterium]|jgi:predicted RNA-binding protein with PUA-like domain|nr:EVE domain-containing protein [Cytophagales bacterium]MCA6389695.1 EVE domain-containing protein [Cytophagales bacterium]MCA6392587.1 EVE domain-containing protein [Cytophagales bacterium]MCA6395586.1 EVE domain-containing protein [Cytophagales bacterium]MCA6400288.1 EVE domain-containing protein [Cytophagales bacterium]